LFGGDPLITKLKKSVPLSNSFLLPIAIVIGKFTDHFVPGLAWYFSLLIVACAVLLIDGLLRGSPGQDPDLFLDFTVYHDFIGVHRGEIHHITEKTFSRSLPQGGSNGKPIGSILSFRESNFCLILLDMYYKMIHVSYCHLPHSIDPR
jgi:hypothetical protein